jgi:hypothetical protein
LRGAGFVNSLQSEFKSKEKLSKITTASYAVKLSSNCVNAVARFENLGYRLYALKRSFNGEQIQ